MLIDEKPIFVENMLVNVCPEHGNVILDLADIKTRAAATKLVLSDLILDSKDRKWELMVI